MDRTIHISTFLKIKPENNRQREKEDRVSFKYKVDIYIVDGVPLLKPSLMFLSSKQTFVLVNVAQILVVVL